MKRGELIEGFKTPPHPKGLCLEGALIHLEPLNSMKHGPQLFDAVSQDGSDVLWDYLLSGPYKNLAEFTAWLSSLENKDDQVFFAVVRKTDKKPLGLASYLRINQQDGTIEVGHLLYSFALQRTTHATEAMYLMMKWVFENGYRRYEWKCNALNKKSRRAAQRLGFSYEGIFRQMKISKGRNRDTAWFAIIDKEWDGLKECFENYLSSENFDENNAPKTSLSSMTRKLLYKIDAFELS